MSKNKANIQSACDALLQVLKPGDVVNQVSMGHHWWEFWLTLAELAIRHYQKSLFGKNSDWRDTHTMLFFDADNTFSVELPKATLKPLETYCLTELSIFRINLIELTEEHLVIMRQTANDIKGTDYDIGQLLDIAINKILGYEYQRKVKLFDFGKKKKVCSVGVRAVFEKLFQVAIRNQQNNARYWLFNELNSKKWPVEKIQEYRGTDVEMTIPAHFANTSFFASEFELIARFKDGRQIYPNS